MTPTSAHGNPYGPNMAPKGPDIWHWYPKLYLHADTHCYGCRCACCCVLVSSGAACCRACCCTCCCARYCRACARCSRIHIYIYVCGPKGNHNGPEMITVTAQVDPYGPHMTPKSPNIAKYWLQGGAPNGWAPMGPWSLMGCCTRLAMGRWTRMEYVHIKRNACLCVLLQRTFSHHTCHDKAGWPLLREAYDAHPNCKQTPITPMHLKNIRRLLDRIVACPL
jgi:hypothetical protein